MHREVGCEIPVVSPFFTIAAPQIPIRCPPGPVRYPCAMVAAAQGEYCEAALMVYCKSAAVTHPEIFQPRSLHINSGACPSRRRSSYSVNFPIVSTWLRIQCGTNWRNSDHAHFICITPIEAYACLHEICIKKLTALLSA